eukprot:3104898-Alexandrium_andersonii.AAC.1
MTQGRPDPWHCASWAKYAPLQCVRSPAHNMAESLQSGRNASLLGGGLLTSGLSRSRGRGSDNVKVAFGRLFFGGRSVLFHMSVQWRCCVECGLICA